MANTLQTSLDKQYESYGRRWDAYTGSDMHIVFTSRAGEPKTIGNVSSLTVAIVREVVPRYTSGSADVRAFAKGKRGISGTMTYAIFDRHPLLRDAYSDIMGKNLEALWKTYFNTANVSKLQGDLSPAIAQSINEAIEIHNFMSKNIQVRYMDQLPPLDVTISFINDSGNASVARLKGVTFLSEGIGFGQDDATQELAATYVATGFEPLTAVYESTWNPITVST